MARTRHMSRYLLRMLLPALGSGMPEDEGLLVAQMSPPPKSLSRISFQMLCDSTSSSDSIPLHLCRGQRCHKQVDGAALRCHSKA